MVTARVVVEGVEGVVAAVAVEGACPRVTGGCAPVRVVVPPALPVVGTVQARIPATACAGRFRPT